MFKNLPAMRETWVQFLGGEDPLKNGMAIQSSILAWKIPWTEKPDRLQSTGSQRVGHDGANSLHFTSLSVCILSWWLNDKEFTCQYRRFELNLWVRKIPWRRE